MTIAPPPAAAPTDVTHLRVGGMDCPSCARTLETALGRVPGVRGVDVDFLQGRVRVTSDGPVAHRRLARAVEQAGYSVSAPEQGGATNRTVAALTVAAGVLSATGLALMWMGAAAPSVGAFAGAILAGGAVIAPQAWRALRQRRFEMNVLMLVAAIGASAIGEWAEAATALFLFSVAQWLEGRAVSRARRAIGALMELAPAEARVSRGGVEQRMPVADVQPGDEVRVRPGERIPLDGVVIEGHSTVDQSPLTGESLPVERGVGDTVLAGAINQHGTLLFRSTRPAGDTTLAHILKAVAEAQSSRAPIQTFVDRFAAWYTPLVIVGAGLVALMPPLLGLGLWTDWLYRALTLLVVACPCALVISTPVTIASALAGAARAGVLIKGGAELERAADVSVVVFDKTGTLTAGRPEVTEVVSLGNGDSAEVLRLAAAVERHSEHPVARAVVRAAARRGLLVPDAVGFTAAVGAGARAEVERRELHVGNARVCAALGTCTDLAHSELERLTRAGGTAVLLTDREAPLGVLGLQDAVRPDARESVAALRRLGIRRLVLLTGDAEPAARAVADAVGLSEVQSGLLPQEKLAAVRRLESEGERVAVVGDGINDAPALAAATSGIAMGVAGSDAALETADIALMADDLRQLAPTIRRARRARRLVRQNIAVALGLKGAVLVLAVGGWATLWLAVLADVGTSIAVVLNGLRALRAEPLD